MTDLRLGPYTVQPLTQTNRRLSMLLWGSAGCGKTCLAATAPGQKLWINFDPDGTASLGARDDVLLVDLSGARSDVVTQVKSEDPFGISAFLKANPDIETVVIDSVTSFAQQAVTHSYTSGRAPGATFENPGKSGYGQRNRFSLGLIKNVLRATHSVERNVIFVCHEDVPKTDTEGNILFTTLLLGGSLPEEVPLQISEVWHMRDFGKDRKITVRSSSMYKPMKTRMFDTTRSIEFSLKYDANTRTGDGISTWVDDWRQHHFNKIPIPK